MGENRPDVIQILQQEKEWYLEQIKRINIALAALTSGANAINQGERLSRQVAWSSEIDKLFEKYDELSFDEIRNKLAEKGIAEALDAKYRGVILATIGRKTKKTILLTANKRYQKIKKSEGDSI